MAVSLQDELLVTYQAAVKVLLETARETDAGYRAELKEKLLAKGDEQEQLAHDARQVREAAGENSLIVRASLEFSNVCRQICSFCGMTARNKELSRYRMSVDQMDGVIKDVADMGIRDMHLASGEDWGFKVDALSSVIRSTVDQGMELTLVTSQRKSPSDYRAWKNAGASRYILKVETTSQDLFKAARTGTHLPTRVSHLLYLRDLGFKIGSGIICGLPDQTADSLVDDLLFLKGLKPDMASVSRFLPNDRSRYAQQPEGDPDITLNFLSLLRTELSTPGLRIPAGTTLGRRQIDAINHGANVVSLHVTPDEHADLYSADRIKERQMTKIEGIRNLSRETGLPLRHELR